MKLQHRLAVFTAALWVTTTTLGGGLDNYLPDPSSSLQNFLYLGIGPSLNTTLIQNTVNTSQTITADPTQEALYTAQLKYNHNVINYSPSIEAGYWHLTANDWALGAKILYKPQV